MILASTDWETLLMIVEKAAPPDKVPESQWWHNVPFHLENGWQVVIFYDGDELDYIDSLVTPHGEKIDFWKWPEDTPGRAELIAWRRVGDLARFRAMRDD